MADDYRPSRYDCVCHLFIRIMGTAPLFLFLLTQYIHTVGISTIQRNIETLLMTMVRMKRNMGERHNACSYISSFSFLLSLRCSRTDWLAFAPSLAPYEDEVKRDKELQASRRRTQTLLSKWKVGLRWEIFWREIDSREGEGGLSQDTCMDCFCFRSIGYKRKSDLFSMQAILLQTQISWSILLVLESLPRLSGRIAKGLWEGQLQEVEEAR